MDKLYDLRIDHKLAESNKWGTHWLEAVWHWEHDATSPSTDAQFPKGIATNCTGSVCDIATATEFRQRLGALAINSTFGASAFNEVRVGFSRPDFTFLPPKPLQRTFNVYFPGVANQSPNPTANAISNPEYAYDPQGRLSPFYSLTDNFTKVKGAHTIKAGFLVSSTSTHRFNDFAGGAGVNGGVTPVVLLGVNANNNDGLSNCAGFPSLPAGTTGSSVCTRAQNIYASLVGLVNNISETYNAVPGAGLRAGPDRRVLHSRALVQFLRPGFVEGAAQSYRHRRCAMGSGSGSRHGKQAHAGARQRIERRDAVRTALPAQLHGHLQRPAGESACNTQLVAGGASNGNPFWKTKYNNLAPSIGVAWQANSKTVIRSGYSISFVRDTLTIISNVTTSNLGLHTGVAVTPSIGDPLAVLNPNVNQVLPPPAIRRSRNRSTRTSWRAFRPPVVPVSTQSIPTSGRRTCNSGRSESSANSRRRWRLKSDTSAITPPECTAATT